MRVRKFRSAIFALHWPESDDHLSDIMAAIGQLYASGRLTDYMLRGTCGSENPGRLKVQGTEDGLAQVAAILQGPPLLVATLICESCLEREAFEVDVDADATDVVVAICEVCRQQGLSSRVLQRKKLRLKG